MIQTLLPKLPILVQDCRITSYNVCYTKLLRIDPKSKSVTKVGFKVEGDKKVRFSKKSNQVL